MNEGWPYGSKIVKRLKQRPLIKNYNYKIITDPSSIFVDFDELVEQ